MADPISAFSAFAAATQIAEQAFKVTMFMCDLAYKVREGAETTSKRVHQLEELVRLCRRIAANPVLQTDSVSSILQPCLDSSTRLHTILGKLVHMTSDSRWLKYKKIIIAVLKGKEIDDLFSGLESEKSLLMIWLQETTSDNTTLGLNNIQDSMAEMSPVVERISNDVTSLSTTVSNLVSQVISVHNEVQSLEGGLKVAYNEIAITARKLDVLLPRAMQHITMCRVPTNTFSAVGYDLATKYIFPKRRAMIEGIDNINLLLGSIDGAFCQPSGSSENIVYVVNDVQLHDIGVKQAALDPSTEVVLQFCHWSIQVRRFGAIFWLDASSPDVLVHGLLSIGDELSIPKNYPTTELRVRTVLSFISGWPCRWLFVLANYDTWQEPKDLINFLPESELGAIIVIGETPHAHTLQSRSTRAPEMTMTQALEFLFNEAPVPDSGENLEAGLELVQLLGRQPKTLAHAADYIRRHNIGLGTLLSRIKSFTKQRKNLTIPIGPNNTTKSQFQSQRILRRMRTSDEGCRNGLKLLTFFDTSQISQSLLQNYSQTREEWKEVLVLPPHLFSSADEHHSLAHATRPQPLIPMGQYSILNIGRETAHVDRKLTIHPVTKQRLRAQINKRDGSIFTFLAAEILYNRLIEVYNSNLCDHDKSPSSTELLASIGVSENEVLAHIEAFWNNVDQYSLVACRVLETRQKLSKVADLFAHFWTQFGRPCPRVWPSEPFDELPLS